MNELEAFVVLNNIRFLGSVNIRVLVDFLGSASKVLLASPEKISSLPGFSCKRVKEIVNWRENGFWKEDLRLIEKHSVNVLNYTDSKYPKKLYKLKDFPPVLYVKGDICCCDKCIGVVGTRNATRYGMETAKNFSNDLASMGFTIVSGLARGIDTSAHRGALCSGKTIAVLGSGLANIYPKENSLLFDEISKSGAVVSEYPMFMKPNKAFFPKRNRIIASFCDALFLVEAPIRSGAMITSEIALMQKKPLFVLPGRVDLENFRGNHKMIKAGKSYLVENARDIACHFGIKGVQLKTCSISNTTLGIKERRILSLLSCEELTIDELQQKVKLSIAELSSILMNLVLCGVIEEFPGKVYKKL